MLKSAAVKMFSAKLGVAAHYLAFVFISLDVQLEKTHCGLLPLKRGV